jgi:hypothetical protein
MLEQVASGIAWEAIAEEWRGSFYEGGWEARWRCNETLFTPSP